MPAVLAMASCYQLRVSMSRRDRRRAWMLDTMMLFIVAVFAYSIAQIIAHAALR